MQEYKGLTVRDILNIIYKRILILKLVVILVPIGVLIACLMATPVYQVGAKLIVTAKKDEASLLSPSGPGPSRVLNLNVDEIDLNSEMEILRSPDLWTRTVKALGPNFFKDSSGGIINKALWLVSSEIGGLIESAQEPKKDENKGENEEDLRNRAIASGLMSRFDVTPVPRSKVLDVTFKDSNPDRVQKILSTLLEVYIPFHSQVYSIPGVQVFFSEQLAASREKYELARQILVAFKKQTNMSIPERQETDAIATLKTIDDALIDIKFNLKQYAEMQAVLTEGNMPTGQLTPGLQRGGENTVMNVLAIQLVQAGQKQLQLGELFTKNSRDYIVGEEQYKDVYARFKSALTSEVSLLEVKKASLEESRDRVIAQMQTMLGQSEEIRALQLDLSVAREQYLQFVGKDQSARLEQMESRQKLVDVKILGQPYPPKSPIFPKTGQYVFLAFLFSFPLGIGIIFVATFLDHSFDDPSRLEAATGYKVLASFGKMKKEEPPKEET